MSWDIYIQDFPVEARTVEDIPDDFVPCPIGERDELIRKIKDAIPNADFSSPALGEIVGEGFYVDIALDDEKKVMSIMLHVYGGGEAATVVAEIVRHLGMRAFDFGSGEFFDPERAEQWFKRWQKYRDQITGEAKR